MKVCIFMGSYDFVEDKLFQDILEKQQIEVVECREKINNIPSFITGYVKLFFRHINLNYDLMLIHWRGIMAYPLARLVCRKPIIYWANLSIYHTIIEDRKKAKPNSFYAKFVHFVEKYVCQHSDMIITESKAQTDYLVNEYNLNPRKFKNVVNSVDEKLIKQIPFKQQGKKLSVLFFGSFAPAHGIDIIIESARILCDNEDIIFNLMGDGPEKEKMEKLVLKYGLKNVIFSGYYTYEKLIPKLAETDICLGIFGKSEKAANVIPNKVLQILASQKPMITMEAKGIKEINLQNEENSILIPKGDPQSLANAILLLKNNVELRKKIAINGNALYWEKLSNKQVGRKLLKFFNEVIEIKKA